MKMAAPFSKGMKTPDVVFKRLIAMMKTPDAVFTRVTAMMETPMRRFQTDEVPR